MVTIADLPATMDLMMTFVFKHKDDDHWIEYYSNGKLVGTSKRFYLNQENHLEVESYSTLRSPKGFDPPKKFTLNLFGTFDLVQEE